MYLVKNIVQSVLKTVANAVHIFTVDGWVDRAETGPM